MIVGREFVRVDSVPSTMDLLTERATTGAEEGLVIVADEQTAGRGRAGHGWEAPPGTSLLCSILLRPNVKPDRLGVLGLLVGVAVADAIESTTSVQCQLKWPNDVWIDGLKVAGILLQSRLNAAGVDFVNVGIGINVTTPEAQLVPAATSLFVVTGQAISRDEMLDSLCGSLDRVYNDFMENSSGDSMCEWRQRAALIGENVSVVQDGVTLTGRFLGVDDDGKLLLETDDGHRVALVQGDLLMGPRQSQ